MEVEDGSANMEVEDDDARLRAEVLAYMKANRVTRVDAPSYRHQSISQSFCMAARPGTATRALGSAAHGGSIDPGDPGLSRRPQLRSPLAAAGSMQFNTHS